MNRGDEQDHEDTFDAWVVAYHEALGDADRGTPVPQMPASAELRPRLQRAQTCLDLLERVWPRSRLPSADLPERIGRFRIRRELGHGGFGVVFLAEDPKLGREVALKVPRGEALVTPELRRRFVREAQAAAGLSHPNIVGVHEAGEAGAILWIASEYCPGLTLADWLRQRDLPVPPRSAAVMVATLAEAVHHVHSRGILHRDLKPGNILLTASLCGSGNPPLDAAANLESFVAKLTDFGLAKAVEHDGDETRTGATVGTPRYMAPEQVLGRRKDIDWRTDVYALGAVLYELLTLQPPFRGETDAEVRQQVLSREPTPPGRLAKVPRDLETICLKCLQKEPPKRYATARDLADDLRRFLSAQPIHARPVRLWDRGLKWARRRPAAAALVALLALGLPFAALAAWQYEANLTKAQNQASLQDERRRAAEEIAANHRYYSLVSGVAESAAQPRPGWTWQGLKDLEEAARLDVEARDPARLRSLATQCLAAVDLRQTAALATGTNAFCVAFSPDGDRLAIGQAKGLGRCSVQLYSVSRRERIAEYTFATSLVEIRQTGVRSLAFSPDGRWLVAGTRNGELHVWDTSGEQPPRPIRSAHKAEIGALAFRPDGERLISGSQDKTLKVWDTAHWKELARHNLGKPVDDLAFNATGSLLACGTPDWVRLVVATSLEPGQSRLAFTGSSHPNDQRKVHFSRDGRILAASRFGRISVTDLEYNLRFRVLRDSDYRGNTDAGIDNLDVSADGSLIVSAGADRKVKLWEMGSGLLLAALFIGGTGHVYAALSPTGPTLAVTAEEEITLYEVGGLHAQTVMAHRPWPVRAIAFGPEGRSLACLAEAAYLEGLSPVFELSLWDVADGHLLNARRSQLPGKWQSSEGPPCLAFHPGNTQLAYKAEAMKGFALWDGSTKKSSDPASGLPLFSLSFARDGETLWGAHPDHQVIALRWPELSVASTWSNSLQGNHSIHCVSAGGRWVLAGSRDASTKLLRVRDGQLEHQWRSLGGPVHSVALSPDESLAASGSQKGIVQVVRVPGGEPVMEREAHRDLVCAVAFSPDGRLLATGSKDRTVRLWQRDGESLRELLTLTAPGPVESVRFSPDGTKLALLVQNEYAVRLWHLDRLQEQMARIGLGW